MPRFSIKSLFVSTTLIAIGTAMVCAVPAYERRGGYVAVCFLLWFVGGAIIGAGLFVPFNKPWFGIVFGVAAMGAILCLLATGVIYW